MRWLFGILVVLLLVMGYRLLFAQGSIAEQRRLEAQVLQETRVNQQLRERNEALEREVLELQTGNKGVEQRAREELGLIRDGETYYQIADEVGEAEQRQNVEVEASRVRKDNPVVPAR